MLAEKINNELTYSVERYEDILCELKDLLPSFFKEVDIYPENPTPNINHDELINLDDLGVLQVVTSRADKLVGFHISIIRNDLFYQHIKMGYVLFYYLLPDYRGNGNGTSMFEYADQCFKDEDVERVFMSRKIYIDNSKLFKNLGYTQFEANYTKALK